MRKPVAVSTLQIVAISVAAVALASGALAQGTTDADRYFCGPHMMWWTGGWYGMIFCPLFMIQGLAVVIALVVLFARWLGGPWSAHYSTMPPTLTALDT